MNQRTTRRETRLSEQRTARLHVWANTTRCVRRGRSGQSLVIFALSLTVLLALAGLSIDVMRLYDTYARAERAAESGALAGVMYLPCFYNSNTTTSSCSTGNSPDGKSATQRALEEVYRNGFGALPSGPSQATPCPTPATAVEVAVCPVSGKATDLRVTITESISIFLLSAIGVNTTTVSASAQAEYLPPIQLGSRYTYFGDQGECVSSGVYSECSPNDTSKTHVQNFLASINGPMELKEQGDAYVYCEEGPSQLPPADSSNHTYNGFQTNHATYANAPHCGAGNPDQQPNGYNGPMTAGTLHPSAYNYGIVVPPGAAGSTVWVYTPNYIPQDIGTNSSDQFLGPYSRYPYNLGSGYYTYNGYFDDPVFYFNTTYTIYSAPVTYLRSQDTVAAGPPQTTFPPYDMMSSDLSQHGCPTDGNWVYDLGDPHDTYTGGAIDSSGAHCQLWSTIMSARGCVGHWCPISPTGGLASGSYRLAVEATGIKSNISGVDPKLFGWGSKNYAVKVCGPGSLAPVGCSAPTGTVLAAWNNMDVIFEAPNNQTSAYFDMACIPSQYAGRTIQMSLFDPGDGNGNIWVRLVPPSGSGITVPIPSGVRSGIDTSGTTAMYVSNSGDRIYNGLWINTPVVLPSTYAGTCGSASGTGWWQIFYSTGGGAPHDKLDVSFSLVGSPVHLVPLG